MVTAVIVLSFEVIFVVGGRFGFLISNIPLLVLTCKVLAKGLPARLLSGGVGLWFLLFLFLIHRFCFFHS